MIVFVSTSSSWVDLSTARGRSLIYVSDFFMVAAVAVAVIVAGKHWAWGPFVAGLAIAVLGVASHALLINVVTRVVRPSAGELVQAKRRIREQRLVVVPNYVTFGLCCALAAGAFRSYILPVVVAALIVLIGVLLPLALLPLLKRKAHARKRRES